MGIYCDDTNSKNFAVGVVPLMERNSDITGLRVPNTSDDHRTPPMGFHFVRRVTYVT
jgi:hypothetical protein